MHILVKADMFENDFWVPRLLTVLAEDKENNCFQLAILNCIKFSETQYGLLVCLERCSHSNSAAPVFFFWSGL